MRYLKSGLIASVLLVGGFSLALPVLGQHWRRSDVGISYDELAKMLDHQQWESAAAETQYLIFQVTQRTQHPPIGRDWLTREGVSTFPCRDLRTINDLWLNASNGHYGFTPQAKLWGKSFNPAQIQRDPQRWERYRDRLGWRPRKDKEFQPDIEGRLPEPIKSTADFNDRPLRDAETIDFAGAAWLYRVEQCKLYDLKEIQKQHSTLDDELAKPRS